MKRFCIFILSIFWGILMLFSCSAQPDTSSLTEGHAYIYNEETLHDLSKLEYTDPGFTVEYEIPSDEELYERVINDPTMFIITFTVVEYTTQNNIEEPAFDDFVGCTLSTRLRVDEIHYLGKDVQINEGEIYNFRHGGAWILEQDDEIVYTIHPCTVRSYALIKYGYQYVMCGGYNFDNNSYYISNYLGYNENTAPEDIWFFK